MIVWIIKQPMFLIRLAPFTIIRPLGTPILTFTKDFKVSMSRVLKRTSNIHTSRRRINSSSRFFFTCRSDGRKRWIDPFSQQSMHLCNLSWMDGNGIFHDSPMIGKSTTTECFHSLPIGTITGWYSLCTRISKVIFRLDINEWLIIVKGHVIPFQKFALCVFVHTIATALVPCFKSFLVGLTVGMNPFLPFFIGHTMFSKVFWINLYMDGWFGIIESIFRRR
mmetsp:Transcript_17689/g.26199  ORF Transcript_17689/g.26199 Transcript_17689/m.26199 type:complete len:222 (-) Transcript_17689:897-1562(-)